jgi:Rps23 Pro-64 3,4-dihydroxylase Tpa1-like proline 4-hydroxylase
MKRQDIAHYIVEKLTVEKDIITNMYQKSSQAIGYFYIDDLLPEVIVKQIYQAFPHPSEMTLKKSIREFKYVSAQMNLYDSILEETIYAFQDTRVVALISEICNCTNLFPDHKLYAGGISMMGKDHFLNPHLDNSHDKDRNLWRVFNLLFYVSPDWTYQNGGHLELWPDGLESSPIVIENKCNRLAVMATHNKSIHSVTKVNSEHVRCCVSNYYFSQNPLLSSDTFHVTSFRGRPESKMTDTLLKIDTFLRMSLRKVFKKGVKENPHYYKKKE